LCNFKKEILTSVGVNTDRFGISPLPLPGGNLTAMRLGVIRPNTCRCAEPALVMIVRREIVRDGPAAKHGGCKSPLPIVCITAAIVILI